MPRFLPVIVATALTLLAVGCGSPDYGGGQDGDSAKKPAGNYGYSSAAKSETTAIAIQRGSRGTYLVDGQKRSLYLFEADKVRSSTCNGGCAEAWPPVTTTSTARGGQGVRPGLVGTTRRANGTNQVTYAGHPLYRYAGDQAIGDTTGQKLDRFGAEWYLVKPDGGALH